MVPVGELLCGMPTSVASLPTVHRLAVSSIVSIVMIVCERPSRMQERGMLLVLGNIAPSGCSGTVPGIDDMVPYGGVACGFTTITRLPRVVAPMAL